MPTDRAQGRDRRLLAQVQSVGDGLNALAARVGWELGTVRDRLRALRAGGFAKSVTLWRPERAGRPCALLVYVSVARPDRARLVAFETWLKSEAAVTHAVQITGRWDYALWTWHANERTAAEWRHALQLQTDVARCEARLVRVLFGHALPGAPIFQA